MAYSRRFWTALALVPLLAGTAAAQVKTRMITLKSGDEEIQAFLAEPAGKGPHPGLIVIQEWWGLNDWIKENARRFAEKGFVALAPDLYRGKVTDRMEVAAKLRTGLPNDRALRDLKAAVDTLSSLPNVNKNRIGSIGWCMGGGFSLEAAIADPRIKACVMCYGAVITERDLLKKLKAPVLGIFGQQDKGIKVDAVLAFEKVLKEVGDVERIHIFGGAGHGFMRPTNGTAPNPAYREVQTREAWMEIDQFLNKRLVKK
jgi:carboxymethylenebutenolidase